MNPDPDLHSLIQTWKDDPMPDVQACFDVTRLSKTRRWEGIVGTALAIGIGGVAVAAAVSGLRSGEPAPLVLAAFLVVAGTPFVRGLRRLRRVAAEADALLSGSPVDVVRGTRRHLHAELCALTSPSAVAVNVAAAVLWIGMAAYGAVDGWLAVTVVTGYGGWFVAHLLRRVPRLRAEIGRLDALEAELGEG